MTLTGGTLLGFYEILDPLASGAMGDVYRAKDRKLGRPVAIKVLRPELASDTERRQRFEQEARAASVLNHPNIVTICDIGEHHGDIRVVMLKKIKPGNALMYYPEANVLVERSFDPASKTPAFKGTVVTIETGKS